MKSILALCAALPIALAAQTFTTLYSFEGADGANPYGGLVQAANGDLYGTTFLGGAHSRGTIFKITPGGTLTTLYSFCSEPNCADGGSPDAGLVQATNGDLYGTTYLSGANGDNGTVFKITPGGTFTSLYSFCALPDCADGARPHAGLIQAINGDLYGTTEAGGVNGGNGTVFKITPGGTLTTLYSFCALPGCADGASPDAGLIQASNGFFYGTTQKGGVFTNAGTVFQITPGGTLTTLHQFCSVINCPDGSYPLAGLLQATNGNLYGTTHLSGWAIPSNAACCGTIFQINPSGAFSTLYRFCALKECVDGGDPSAALIQGNDGNLYGTTYLGGTGGAGIVFEITLSGTLTVLQNFDGTNGQDPVQLFQDTNGTFYGAAYYDFANEDGTIFSLSTGLGPFVRTLPAAGLAGTGVRILGTNLTGATGVTFNGTAAAFAVVSSSEIVAAVPSGATSGKVQVVTPGGTLSSTVPFGVLP
jgi:uncharacterized repeat protein (TIGR03803 family)